MTIKPSSRRVEALLLTLALLTIFVFANRSLLFDPGLIPTYDFSANDLLVQDAKKWALFHGNYSKIGFFHPGPVFLQWSALFEWIGFDVLGIFGSPIGALAFGSAFLHSVALATFYLSLRALYASRIHALAAVLVTMAVCSWMIGPGQAFFIASWFPYLYTAASLFVLASCIGLATTGWAWLPVGVVGLCMLVHGHASFIGLVPIMGACAVAALLLVQRFRPAWLGADMRLQALPRWVVCTSLAAICWFSFPIVANTILHFPGEVPKYFRFAALPRADSLGGRIQYLGHFFTPALLAIPVLLMLPARWSNVRLKLAVGVALLVGGPATVFYVLRGLDTTDHYYPVYWSTIFFGGAAAISILGLVQAIGRRSIEMPLAAVLAAGAIFSIPVSSLTPDVSQPGSEVDAALKQIANSMPEGGYAWIDADVADFEVVFDMSTLAAMDKRSPRQRVCITAGYWSAMYPPAIACDPVRMPMAARLQATSRSKHPAAAIQFAHTALLPIAPSMRMGDAASFSITPSSLIFGPGWSTTEGTGRWTDGQNASLLIPSSELPRHFHVHLVFHALLTPTKPSQTITFLDANDALLKRVTLTSSESSAAIDLPLDNALSASGLSVIRIAIESPRRPVDLGLGPDLRELGLFLRQLEIRP